MPNKTAPVQVVLDPETKQALWDLWQATMPDHRIQYFGRWLIAPRLKELEEYK